MKKTSVLLLCVSVLFLMVAGCAHYKVKNNDTGKAYYTKDVDRLMGGGVKFEDEATGREVRIKSSEITKISSEEYRQGISRQDSMTDEGYYGEKWEDSDKESTDGCR